MRSDVVVIACIGSQDPVQMCLTQDDEMIDTLAPDRSDQPFGKAILPRRGRRGGLVPDPHGAQSVFDDNTIDPIPVANHVAWCGIPRESLGYTSPHMNVDFFLKERTRFIREYYATAITPFETVR